MPLDPALAALFSILGGGIAGALSPNPQQRQSFGNAPAMLNRFQSMLDELMPGAIQDATQPVDLSHTRPVRERIGRFTGGGLPVDIGLSEAEIPPGMTTIGQQPGGIGTRNPNTPTGSEGGAGTPGGTTIGSLPGATQPDPSQSIGPQRRSGVMPMQIGSQARGQGAAQLLLAALRGNPPQKAA